MGAISEEFRDVRLDIRLGRTGPSSGGGEAMNLGSISTIEGFDCRCSLNGESMGVLSADLRLDGLESSTGERGRVVLSAVGAGFLVPFHIDSCVLPGVVLMIDGTGGASVAELFIVEYLLLDEFGTLDFDRNWAEITDGDIESNDRALYGADPESWRYFLPAWMIWSLQFFRTNDLFIVDQIIYTFDPHLDNPELRRSVIERHSLLSPQQSAVVYRFLDYMSRNGDHADAVVALRAIEGYWGQFARDKTK